MPITLGLNIASLRSQRQLERSSNQLSNVYTRLSSGQRINKASDDAAGLAIADSLNADARVFGQGIRNLNDGISILNVADGALQELTNITFRLTELAEQAANGVLGKAQRASLDEEAQALKDEYFRIAKSTEFNGRKLFEGDYGELRLQAGYGLNASIGDGLGGAIGTGEFTLANTVSVDSSGPREITAGDFNGDGNLDFVESSGSGVNVHLGAGDGTFQYGSNVLLVDSEGLGTGDFNNDGILDLIGVSSGSLGIAFGDGDGNFSNVVSGSITSNLTGFTYGDYNGDGILDVATGHSVYDFDESEFVNTTIVSLGNGDGTFSTAYTHQHGAPGEFYAMLSTDLNGDNVIDLALTNEAGQLITLEGDGSGSFQVGVNLSPQGGSNSIVAEDFTGDGIVDLFVGSSSGQYRILSGDGQGGFTSTFNASLSGGTDIDGATTADYNGDGLYDIVTIDYAESSFTFLAGTSEGEFTEGDSYSTELLPVDIVSGDFNNDGVADVVTANWVGDSVSLFSSVTTDGVAPLLDFSLNSIADAKQALSQFTQKLDQLSAQRGQIGAFQSRVEVAEKVLSVSAENYKAAESRIRDADIAQEAADLVRLQILQQASAAVLGQANQQPQLVLQLLGGGN